MPAPEKLEVLVCSSNIGNTQMSVPGMKEWVFQEGIGNGKSYDVIAIGMQEAMFSVNSAYREAPPTSAGAALSHDDDDDDDDDEEDAKADAAAAAAKEKGTKSNTGMGATAADALTGKCGKYIQSVLEEVLGSDYYLVASQYSLQMRLYVFAKTAHKKSIKNTEKAKENTGLAGIMGNKGGQVVKLDIYDISLCFVSCHLAAHEGAKYYNSRNDSVREIFGGARVGNKQLDAASQFHHCFFMGDMNYRTDLSLVAEQFSMEGKSKDEKKAIKKQVWDIVTSIVNELDENPKRAEALKKLEKMDELATALKKQDVLCGWHSDFPTFKPTFKVYRWEQLKYVTKRTPSYCDRILWRSLPGFTDKLSLQQGTYEACDKFVSSDHKPIRAGFTIQHLNRAVGGPSVASAPFRLTISDIEYTLKGRVTKDKLDVPDPYFKIVATPHNAVRCTKRKDGIARTRHLSDTISGKFDRDGDTIVCDVHATKDQLWKVHVLFTALDNNHTHKDRPLGSAELSLSQLVLDNADGSQAFTSDLLLNSLIGGEMKCKIHLQTKGAHEVTASSGGGCCSVQ